MGGRNYILTLPMVLDYSSLTHRILKRILRSTSANNNRPQFSIASIATLTFSNHWDKVGGTITNLHIY